MENRSRGMQLSTIFFALGAALLAPSTHAFFDRLRTSRDIVHHPENLVGLLPMHDGKYPPIGKSAHYHPAARPPYYENQPPYNNPPFFDGQQPPHSEPRVMYDGPPPSYHSGPPPPSYDQPLQLYNVPPPQYNAPPPPPFDAPPPPPFEAPPPPPPPLYSAPPPPYNSRPPPYNLSPSRGAPPPPSIYVPPLYNSPKAPFHQVVYDSPPSYNLPPPHHHAPSPSHEQPPAQDNSQSSIQLIFELPRDKNNSSSTPSLDSKDIAVKSESNDTITSPPTGSVEPPLILQNPSSSFSESPSPLSPSDSFSNGAPALAIQDPIQDQIPEEPSPKLPFKFPPHSLYNSPPKTYQATMAYDQKPPWADFRPEYCPIESNYERPPSRQLFNRIPRNFDFEAFPAAEYRPRSFYEPDVGGAGFDYGKPLRQFDEFEGGPGDGPINGFDRRAYEDEPPRMHRHYRFPGDENPYKPYRPYKRHDNYVQNHYNLESELQYQPYADAVRGQPSIVPPGLEISEGLLESIIKQAIHAVRQEEAEEQRAARLDQHYVYESPYAEERPVFVTMQQPKRYQLEPYAAEEEPARFVELPPETREIEWTPVDSVPETEQLHLGETVLDADADEQPAVAELIGGLEQPPPTVTEPTIVDLLKTTSMSR